MVQGAAGSLGLAQSQTTILDYHGIQTKSSTQKLATVVFPNRQERRKPLEAQFNLFQLSDPQVFRQLVKKSSVKSEETVVSIVDRALEKIRASRLAIIKESNSYKLREYLNKSLRCNLFYPTDLILLLEEMKKVISRQLRISKVSLPEIEYLKDEEEIILEGISITVYVGTRNVDEISSLWQYLNMNVGIQNESFENVFFRVKSSE